MNNSEYDHRNKQRHVHFAKACTKPEDEHKHMFQVASLINSPIDFECS